MLKRNKVAAGFAVVAAVAVGGFVLACLVRVATWGGPDGDSDAVTDLPFGLLLIFGVPVLVAAVMAGKLTYELLRRR